MKWFLKKIHHFKLSLINDLLMGVCLILIYSAKIIREYKLLWIRINIMPVPNQQ